MTRRIFKSDGELNQLQQQQTKQDRIERLLSVRMQHKKISKHLRHKTKECQEKAKEEQFQQLREEWDKERQEKIKQLEIMHQRHLESLGQGHKEAAKFKSQQLHEATDQFWKYMKTKELQADRCHHALVQKNNDYIQKNQSHILKQQRHNIVQTVEQKRAEVIRNQPRKSNDDLKDIEEAFRQSTKKVSNQPNPTQYKTSWYHDHLRKRNQHNVVVEKAENKENIKLATEIEIARNETIEKKKKSIAVERRLRAIQRGRMAYQKIKNQQQKEQVESELETVKISDIRRKQREIGQCRNEIPDIKSQQNQYHQLERAFEKEFLM